MSRFVDRFLAPLLAASVLVACGGKGDTGNHSGCVESFASKGAIATSVTSSPACSLRDASLSVDGERDSFASMDFSAGGCTQTLVATLPDPAQFSSGSVGAFMQLPSTVSAGTPVTLNTYLDGTLQDSSVNHGGISVTTMDQGHDRYYGFPTNLPFDEVDTVIDLTGAATAETIRIYEFCGDAQ